MSPAMTMAQFIRAEIGPIVDEWEVFARTCLPAAKPLESEALRDHARVMLLTFADDMAQVQSAADRSDKSLGDLQLNSPVLTRASHGHAAQRFAQGFTLSQMASEYRALRAAVVRRWRAQLREVDEAALDEVVRFDEAVDQSIAEAIVVYTEHVEASRNILLATLGHDLRNPLGAVRMSAEYLLRTEGLDGQQTLAAGRIVNSSNTMNRLIDDLLNLTQTLLTRSLPLKIEALDMGDLCAGVVDELVACHPGRDVRFSREGGLSGFWDAGRVAQLVSNLVANAIQHGAALRPVKVSVTGESDCVVVQVHNEGVPIPDGARPSLFEPKFADSARRQPRTVGSSGMGLGLYIAHEIVEAHKGWLEVESNQGEGTTFTVRLPRTIKAQAAA